MNVKPYLLHLADQLDSDPAEVFPSEISDELRRLHQVELAFNEWLDKTEWVQETCQYYELGLHRADVLKRRIEYLQSRIDSLMLEFCPEDMTKEQLENWKKNQKVHK